MIGDHGIPGAPRAGAAVLSVPVRRALVLGGLLLVALAAVWLAAVPAQAEEHPTLGPEVLADVGQGLQQEVTDVTGLQEPLTGTVTDVTDVGEHAAQVVEDTSGHLPTDTGAPDVPDLGEVTRRVHDDVYTAVENAPEDQGGPVREDETEEETEAEEETAQDGRGNAPRAGGVAPAESPSPVEETTVSAAERAPADAVAEPVDEGHDAGDATPTTGSGGGTALSSSSAPTASAHGVAAGYLSAPGAPAPAPGELQAAQHVLRSVPAAPADESTFSPD